MKTLQKTLYLWSYLIFHSRLCHPLNPIVFILLRNEDILPTWNQFNRLIHTKSMTDVSKILLIHNWIIPVVLHRFIQMEILLLQIRQFQLLS